jgi:hypothetical protein
MSTNFYNTHIRFKFKIKIFAFWFIKSSIIQVPSSYKNIFPILILLRATVMFNIFFYFE